MDENIEHLPFAQYCNSPCQLTETGVKCSGLKAAAITIRLSGAGKHQYP